MTATMQELAMAGGRFEVALEPSAAPASFGRESVVVPDRDAPEAGRRGRCRASRRAASCRASRSRSRSRRARSATCRRSCSTKSTPASAARSRRRSAGCCRRSGERRQVLCVTHLPQVAAHADHHFRVVKTGDRDAGVERARAAVAAARASTSSRGCWRAARSRRRPARTRASCSSSTAESARS